VEHHVFISYIREASDLVDRLTADLRQRGVQPWLDRDHIPPGQRWRDVIRDAIRGGNLFLACFSSDYATRDSTYMNEELTVAIEELRQRPANRSWFIPVSLDGSHIPSRAIGAGETIHDLQCVNLAEGWAAGVERIVNVAAAAPTRRVESQVLELSQPSRYATFTDRALRIDRDRIAAERDTKFMRSTDGVNAAINEVKNLYVTIETRANELAYLTSSLNIESETRFPSCAVRLGGRSVLVVWHHESANMIDDAGLYLLDYTWRYSFSVIRPHEPNVKAKYRFTVRNGEYGWSSSGEFVTSNDITDICFEILLSAAEQ
jgi:hypothetical protein